jgi:ribose 5-phosphate isomerase B
MKIAFACDHAGINMKQELMAHAKELGHEVEDFGTNSTDSCDYPLIVPPVVNALKEDTADLGILLCGSGIGVDIAANRFPDIRSALCCNALMAELARRHNNANVMSLGARIIGIEIAKRCLEQFVATEFESGGRHERRVNQLEELIQ